MPGRIKIIDNGKGHRKVIDLDTGLDISTLVLRVELDIQAGKDTIAVLTMRATAEVETLVDLIIEEDKPASGELK